MQLIEKVEENYRTGDASVESFHFINAHCDMTVAPSKLFTFDYVQKADQPKKTIVAKLAHSVFLSKEDCETKAKEMEDDHSKKDLPWLLSFCEKVDSSSGNPYRLSFAYVQDKSE